jgi:hypothetical protein
MVFRDVNGVYKPTNITRGPTLFFDLLPDKIGND